MTNCANTPEPPYYAVIFASTMTGDDLVGYSATADRIVTLARQQDGFLAVDAAREDIGITVSYWRDLGAIKAWKQQMEHMQAQELGRATWYAGYSVRIAKVEREYSWHI